MIVTIADSRRGSVPRLVRKPRSDTTTTPMMRYTIMKIG